MPPRLRRFFRPLVTLLAVSYALTLLSLVLSYPLLYQFYRVEGHGPENPPSLALFLVYGVEIVAALIVVGSFVALIRAGLFRWWPWEGWPSSVRAWWRDRPRQ